MISDAERREVAARLREYASWDENGELVGCTEFGEAVLNLLSCGDTERECFNALADLIDPTRNCSEPTRTCGEYDRDALLALADEMDEIAQRRRSMGYEGFAIGDEYMARRIRDVLGVE